MRQWSLWAQTLPFELLNPATRSPQKTKPTIPRPVSRCMDQKIGRRNACVETRRQKGRDGTAARWWAGLIPLEIAASGSAMETEMATSRRRNGEETRGGPMARWISFLWPSCFPRPLYCFCDLALFRARAPILDARFFPTRRVLPPNVCHARDRTSRFISH